MLHRSAGMHGGDKFQLLSLLLTALRIVATLAVLLAALLGVRPARADTTQPCGVSEFAVRVGKVVVWAEGTNTLTAMDIYGYNLDTGQTFPICTDPALQDRPAISGNLVVWADRRHATGSSLWVQDLLLAYDVSTGQETVLANLGYDQGVVSVGIDGNLVVWNALQAWGYGDSDILQQRLGSRRRRPHLLPPARYPGGQLLLSSGPGASAYTAPDTPLPRWCGSTPAQRGGGAGAGSPTRVPALPNQATAIPPLLLRAGQARIPRKPASSGSEGERVG